MIIYWEIYIWHVFWVLIVHVCSKPLQICYRYYWYCCEYLLLEHKGVDAFDIMAFMCCFSNRLEDVFFDAPDWVRDTNSGRRHILHNIIFWTFKASNR